MQLLASALAAADGSGRLSTIGILPLLLAAMALGRGTAVTASSADSDASAAASSHVP